MEHDHIDMNIQGVQIHVLEQLHMSIYRKVKLDFMQKMNVQS